MPVRTNKVAWLRGVVPLGLLLVPLVLHVSCGGNTEPPRVSAVRIEPSAPVSLLAGESFQLTAIPIDAGGSALSGLDIDWGSGDSSVAIVDGSGLVTGVMPGSASIVASADTASAEAAVTVLAQVTKLAIGPSAPSLLPGTTIQLTLAAEDAWGGPIDGRPVLWATDDPSVATVSSPGLLTGVRPGSATVTATVSKKTAAVPVLVIEPVSALELAPTSAILHPMEKLQFIATLRDAGGGIIEGRPVGWAVSDPAIASVNDAGLVTAKRSGTVSVSAEAESEHAVAQVKVQVPVGSVVLSPGGGKVRRGSTLQLEVTLRDANGNSLDQRDVGWTSDKPSVATVSGSGLVKGIRPGPVTVTASSEGKEGRANLTVEEPVARVVVTPGSKRLVLGEEFRFKASPRDSDGQVLADRPVEWSSGRSGIAGVTRDGRVTAVGAGRTEIEATSEGVKGDADIEVWEPGDEPVVLVGAGDIATCLGQGDEQTARLLDQIPGVVFTVGDNAYPDGSEADYANCYGPSWGRHKSRTRPVPGNHEYLTPGARGYFDYFGSAAGDPATGYYSYDLGEWHILALNTEFTGKEGSPQAEWVKADLAANRKKCTLAIYHVPLFGRDSASVRMRNVFDLLHKAGAELVINGHEHNYQRYAPQTANGVSDPERGVRQFIIGTGGKGVGVGGMTFPNREVAYGRDFGVLKLKLYRESYSWEFVSVPSETFTDSGSASCH